MDDETQLVLVETLFDAIELIKRKAVEYSDAEMTAFSDSCDLEVRDIEEGVEVVH